MDFGMGIYKLTSFCKLVVENYFFLFSCCHLPGNSFTKILMGLRLQKRLSSSDANSVFH